MARSRNIKPGFFTNDQLAELPALTRLLFVGLWTIADREGRIEDRPKKVKAETMPYDNFDCDEALSDLQKAGFIVRYASGGTNVIQVVNWDKHQNPHVKEQPSTLPEQHKHQTSTVQAPDKQQPSTEVAGLIPDSGFLIPDSSTDVEGAKAAPLTLPAEKQSKGRTLATYLAECKANGVKPIPDAHSIRTWATEAGITPEMLQIAWVQFRERYTEAEKGKGKRYEDWPGHFATAVKANWFKLWFAGDNGMQWSSVGMTHKTVLDARMAQKEAEHA